MFSLRKSSVALIILPCLVLASTTAIAGDGMVKGYVKSSSGEVWKNSYGECWRSRFDESSERLESCGYAAPKPEPVAAPAPPPAPAPVKKMMEKVFENISINASFLFGFDSAVLSDEAKSVIDGHLEKYQGKAALTEKVSVVGHTDSTGPESYNQMLSEKRASSVAKYLEQHANISDTDIEVIGKGESEPAASNSTRDGRAQNRRVDIKLEGKVEK